MPFLALRRGARPPPFDSTRQHKPRILELKVLKGKSIRNAYHAGTSRVWFTGRNQRVLNGLAIAIEIHGNFGQMEAQRGEHVDRRRMTIRLHQPARGEVGEADPDSVAVGLRFSGNIARVFAVNSRTKMRRITGTWQGPRPRLDCCSLKSV